MQKRRPGEGGADLCGDDQPPSITALFSRPDDLIGYRALHLMHALSLRPELAVMVAEMAFGGAR